MSNPLLGLAAAPAEALLTGAINKGFSDSSNREMMKRQHGYNKEQMALQYAYGQKAQRNTASNLVHGLKMAGLSPALASQGNFAAAPSVSASGMPSSTPHNYASPVQGIQNFLELAQAKLTQAQVENVEANTKSVEIKNEQEEDANTASRTMSVALFNKLADSAHDRREREYYLSLANTANTKGSFALFSQLLDNLDKRELYDMHYQQYLLGKNVAYLQVNSDGGAIMKRLADMPSKEYEQMASVINYYTEYAKQLNSQKELTEQEKELRMKQIKLTEEQTQNLIAATRRINDTNLMKIADDVAAGKESPWKLAAAIAFLVFGNVGVHF